MLGIKIWTSLGATILPIEGGKLPDLWVNKQVTDTKDFLPALHRYFCHLQIIFCTHDQLAQFLYNILGSVFGGKACLLIYDTDWRFSGMLS